MIKELMHDPIFLTGKSDASAKDDLQVAQDLLESQPCIKTYTGWTAQIIQHEVDHCNGILI